MLAIISNVQTKLRVNTWRMRNNWQTPHTQGHTARLSSLRTIILAGERVHGVQLKIMFMFAKCKFKLRYCKRCRGVCETEGHLEKRQGCQAP